MRSTFRTGAMAGIAAVALVLTACGGDTATEAPEATDMDTPMATEMDSMLTMEPIGDACDQIPADGDGSSEGMADDPVATAASANPLLTTLVTAVTEANLVDTLNTAESLTVFAPINPAFDALPEGALDAVLADPDLLTSVLTVHVAGGAMDASALATAGTVETLQGGELTFDADAMTITSPDGTVANVVCANVQTSNAVVHLVDTVLMPGDADPMAPESTPTESMATESEMDSMLTMEPIGDACDQIPADGDGSSEGMADDPVATAASANPLLTTLVAAVGQADLVDTLNGAEALTVFAPIDPAFDALPEGTLDTVMGDTDLLTSILTLHVAEGQMDLDALDEGGNVATLNGGNLLFDADAMTVTSPNGTVANVVCGNVQTANATVHLIDAVLLPM